jgi:hypothetical protein
MASQIKFKIFHILYRGLRDSVVSEPKRFGSSFDAEPGGRPSIPNRRQCLLRNLSTNSLILKELRATSEIRLTSTEIGGFCIMNPGNKN